MLPWERMSEELWRPGSRELRRTRNSKGNIFHKSCTRTGNHQDTVSTRAREKKKPGAKVFNECEEVSRLLHHRDENGQKA